MTRPPSDIAGLLARARARARRLAVLEWGGMGLAGGLTAVLLGTGLLWAGVRLSPTRWLVLAGLFAALALAGRRLWRVRRGSGPDEAVARLVAAADPALRSDLVSAVELGRARDGLAASGAASVELLDAHVDRITAAVGGLDLAAALPDRRARRAGWLVAAAAAGWVAALGFGGGGAWRQLKRLAAGDPAAVAGPSLEPITGDIELSFRFPAHTRRPPQLLSGTGGEIRAPRGTEVTLRTRADRPVEAAELTLQKPDGAVAGRVALAVSGGRELSGSLLVDQGGTYRFRFATARGKTVAEGPPIPLVAEPDAFPSVRIAAPGAELELAPDAVAHVEWSAEDDYGLASLSLVLRHPGGSESRRPLRALTGLRRDQGGFDLPLAPERLGEGERLLYWLEVEDNDAVSGPKKGASATQAITIYSEAEHRRAAMEKARAAWERLLAHLGERLELSEGGPVATAARLPLGAALDVKARALHQAVAATAAELRQDPVAPRDVTQALANVAASLRTAEQRATAVRQTAARTLATGQPLGGLVGQVAWADGLLVGELEKDVLYLEQLFDKTRAGELVRLARELSARKRDLQAVLERLRDAPGDAARAEALAQVARLKARMRELQARMAETARGFNDQHLNAEAMAELMRQKDVDSPLDAIERAIQQGDMAAAMKSLDQLSAQLDQLAAGLERTAAVPDAKQRALMQEMLAFKAQLEQVERQQHEAAAQTEKVKNDVRQRLGPRLEEARRGAAALEQLAREARESLEQAQPGVPVRGEPDLDAAREALADLQRALALRDLEAASEQAARADGPTQRLQAALEEEAALAERFPGSTRKGPAELRAAQAQVKEAAPRIARIRDRLRRLTPDPQQAMTPGDRQKLAELAGQQRGLERQAGELQQKLAQLSEKAPIFPPQAQGLLGESRGHMNQAAGELQGRNPQRGLGEQQAALESLGRFKQGLEQMAGHGPGGGGFPFPFGETGAGHQDGDSGEPLAQKVVIPGSEAHKLPEEFRRDLLEAMKQGAPERYRGEVQRYYEELVKMIVALLALALAAPPADLGSAVRRLQDEDVAGAAPVIEAAAASRPGDPLVQLSLGQLRFYQHRYDEAVTLLEAGGRGADPTGLLRMARAAAELGRGREELEGVHFVVAWPRGKDEVLVPYLLETLEAQRAALSADLGIDPPEKVRVEILGSVSDLARLSTLTDAEIRGSGTIALCKYNKLMLVSPKALFTGYDWLDTAAHEYVHYAVMRLAGPATPIWLHEGLARWFETRWRGPGGQDFSPFSAALVRRAVEKGTLVTFEQMHPSMAKLPSQERSALAFAEVGLAVELMVNQGGTPALARVLQLVSGGLPADAAVASALGVSWPDFMASWKRYLSTRPLPKGGAQAMQRLKFIDDPKQGGPWVEWAELDDPRAREFARLGELLRERGRPVAARLEYRKALDRGGARFAVLANQFAVVAIQTGRQAEAEQVLGEAIAWNPDHAALRVRLGRLRLERKDFAGAREQLTLANRQDPFDPEIHAGLALAQEALGDPAAASRERRFAQILQPQGGHTTP